MSADGGRRIETGGPWGTGLLILGVAVLVQGIGYLTAEPGDLAPALEELSQIIPPSAWGTAWVVVGIYCILRALRPPQRPWHILPVVGVFAVWSAAHLMHWLIAGVGGGVWNRSWTGAVGWAMLAGLVACWGRCINPPSRLPR